MKGRIVNDTYKYQLNPYKYGLGRVSGKIIKRQITRDYVEEYEE